MATDYSQGDHRVVARRLLPASEQLGRRMRALVDQSAAHRDGLVVRDRYLVARARVR